MASLIIQRVVGAGAFGVSGNSRSCRRWSCRSNSASLNFTEQSRFRGLLMAGGPSNAPCLAYNPLRNTKRCFRESVRLRKCISRGHQFVSGNASAEATRSDLLSASAEPTRSGLDGSANRKMQIWPVIVLTLGIVLSLRPGPAWAGSATQSLSPEGKGLLASAWAGLVAGCLHTLTGPDHLAALAPLCIGRSRIQSAAVGALWGCGHDAGQILFGLAFLLLKDKLHIELIRTWASRVVGLTLMTIGGVGIYESQEPVAVLVEDAGGIDGGVVRQEVRVKNDSKNATTFATGVVYGLQPDALLMILPALALPSKITGAAFLGMFLLGTVLAMGSYTLFLSSCSLALQKRLPGITKNLTVGSSVIAILLGLALLISELFGVNLF